VGDTVVWARKQECTPVVGSWVQSQGAVIDNLTGFSSQPGAGVSFVILPRFTTSAVVGARWHQRASPRFRKFFHFCCHQSHVEGVSEDLS
jgi:hypothetical protein